MRQKPFYQELDTDWRYVKGYEGLYSVSERGEIWSCRRKRYLKRTPNPRYLVVSLAKNGKFISYTVHSLVAKAFIGKCPKGHEINHKNANKHDNHLNNLEYLTHSANVMHAIKNNIHPSTTYLKRDKLGRYMKATAIRELLVRKGN